MKNKDIICLTIIVIVSMIAISSIIKINKTHEDNLMIVSEKRITEAASKCYKEGKCLDNSSITLETLYANNYLTNESNPLTKEVYNSKSYVTFMDGNYKFIVIS